MATQHVVKCPFTGAELVIDTKGITTDGVIAKMPGTLVYLDVTVSVRGFSDSHHYIAGGYEDLDSALLKYSLGDSDIAALPVEGEICEFDNQQDVDEREDDTDDLDAIQGRAIFSPEPEAWLDAFLKAVQDGKS